MKIILQMLTVAVLMLCIDLTISIVTTCNSSVLCPLNSVCFSNNYCVCNSGYIGNCSTAATVLSTANTSTQLLAGKTNYYEVIPIQLGHYLQFNFLFCSLSISPLNLTLSLWGQTGNITSYTQSTGFMDSVNQILGTGCTHIYTSYILFQKQPNGQPQALILGVYDSSVDSTITISVDQTIIVGARLYQYIVIGLIIMVVLSLVSGLIGWVYTLYRRRVIARQPASANNQLPQYNNIDHLDIFMPNQPVSALPLEQRSVCPICLQEFQEADVYRKTPCKHYFHSICINAWCLKHLNCPVCRIELSFQALNKPKKSTMSTLINEESQVNQHEWEQKTIQMGDAIVNQQKIEKELDRSDIRDSMM